MINYKPGIIIKFPEREIFFSRKIFDAMKFQPGTQPKTLDQWYELCHPEDHEKITQLENFISGNDFFISITRRLYCGDGIYRPFRLDAFIHRDSHGIPLKILCNETPWLNEWLENASEGERIIFNDEFGRERIFEATRIQGSMILCDITALIELENENFLLRKKIINYDEQREIKENKKLLTVGIVGLNGSGKSAFINAMLGEKIIPEQITNSIIDIPIFCKNGNSREAKVFHKNGKIEKISSDKLSLNFIKKLTSDNFNVKNRAEISKIELIIPGSIIPENVILVDTPGFNLFANHGNIILKNLIPEFDMIFYISPVRSELKNQDFELIKIILNHHENFIFLLSQIDVEHDDTEAGKIFLSLNEKIDYAIKNTKRLYKNNFNKDINKIIPVSSKLAFERFFDRKSQIFRMSNFDSILNLLNKSNNNFTSISSDSFTKEIKQDNSENLISSILISMREREFRDKFFSMNSLKNNQKIVMLGSERNESLKLFSNLAHKLILSKLPEGKVNEKEWLCSGVSAPFPCVTLTGIQDEILIAPSDDFIKNNIDWDNLFNSRVPVINLDITRIKSGISDLIRSPYFYALKKFNWILFSSNGNFFESNKNLLSEINIKFNNFADLNDLKKPEWFIFDNYRILKNE